MKGLNFIEKEYPCFMKINYGSYNLFIIDKNALCKYITVTFHSGIIPTIHASNLDFKISLNRFTKISSKDLNKIFKLFYSDDSTQNLGIELLINKIKKEETT